MSDTVATLIRAHGDEDLAELYEAVAEIVCDTEDIEYEHGEYPPHSHFDDLVIAFNACESAIAEYKRRIAAKANDSDTKPAELTGKGWVKR